jgi:hypothetical protein
MRPVRETAFHQRVVNPRALDAGEVTAEAVEEFREFSIKKSL